MGRGVKKGTKRGHYKMRSPKIVRRACRDNLNFKLTLTKEENRACMKGILALEAKIRGQRL